MKCTDDAELFAWPNSIAAAYTLNPVEVLVNKW